MSMSDCVECWSTPCECGHEWNQRPTKYLRKIRDLLDAILTKRRDAPAYKIDGDVVTLSSGRQARLGITRRDTWDSIDRCTEKERRELVDAMDEVDDARDGVST